jgi:hypothetical protein
MVNGQINKIFLNQVDNQVKTEILNNIANHYAISPKEAFEEVIDNEAEHLLDYVTGSCRQASSVLMQKHGFRSATQSLI